MPRLKLEALLSLNKTGFDAGMRAAEHQVQHFSKHLLSHLGAAFSAVSFIHFTESVIEMGTELEHLSMRLGVSVKDVQQFSLAAKLAGLDGDIAAKAFEKVRLAMVEGVGTGKNPLAVFGVTIDELKKGDAAGVLRKLAHELENFAGSADETKALVDVFGAKGMGNMLLMLRELEHAGHASQMSDTEASTMAQFHKAMKFVSNKMKVIGGQFLTQLAYGGLPYSYGGKEEERTNSMPETEGIEARLEREAKAQEELTKLQNKTDELNEKNRIAQLTDEERINELLAQRAELYRQLQFALSEQAEASIRNKIAQSDLDLTQAQAKIHPKLRNPHIETTGLGQIGAFSGGGINQNGPQLQGLQSLRRIESALIQKGILVRDVK